MPNYASSIIYKLCCNNSEITDIYIGSTTNFVKRKQQHKSNCINTNSKDYNYNVYQFIRANGGWSSWNMVEVERYNAIDKRNLLTRERYWLETLKATLNSKIPTRTMQEQQKQYRIENKQELSAYHKQYRIDNKQALLAKITCVCGASTNKSGKAQHMKTKKHNFAHKLHTFIYL